MLTKKSTVPSQDKQAAPVKSISKFLSNLLVDGTGIKEQRAQQLFSSAKIAQSNLVNRLSEEVNNLESKLFGLQDLHPTNSTDLTVGGNNFNPQSWVQELQNTKVALLTKKIELQVAEDTNAEWFL